MVIGVAFVKVHKGPPAAQDVWMSYEHDRSAGGPLQRTQTSSGVLPNGRPRRNPTTLTVGPKPCFQPQPPQAPDWNTDSVPRSLQRQVHKFLCTLYKSGQRKEKYRLQDRKDGQVDTDESVPLLTNTDAATGQIGSSQTVALTEISKSQLSFEDSDKDHPVTPCIVQKKQNQKSKRSSERRLRTLANGVETEQRLIPPRELLVVEQTPKGAVPAEDDCEIDMANAQSSVATQTKASVFVTTSKSTKAQDYAAPPIRRHWLNPPPGKEPIVAGEEGPLSTCFVAATALEDNNRRTEIFLERIYAALKPKTEKNLQMDVSESSHSESPKADSPLKMMPCKASQQSSNTKNTDEKVSPFYMDTGKRFWSTMCRRQCGVCEVCQNSYKIIVERLETTKPSMDLSQKQKGIKTPRPPTKKRDDPVITSLSTINERRKLLRTAFHQSFAKQCTLMCHPSISKNKLYSKNHDCKDKRK